MKTPEWYIILNPIAANGRVERVWPDIEKLLNSVGLPQKMPRLNQFKSRLNWTLI